MIWLLFSTIAFASCPDFSGRYKDSNNFLSSIEQKQCDHLLWSSTDANGQTEVEDHLVNCQLTQHGMAKQIACWKEEKLVITVFKPTLDLKKWIPWMRRYLWLEDNANILKEKDFLTDSTGEAEKEYLNFQFTRLP